MTHNVTQIRARKIQESLNALFKVLSTFFVSHLYYFEFPTGGELIV